MWNVDMQMLCGFEIKNIHPQDLAQFLDQDGIAIRAGQHCTQPIMDKLGVFSTNRASFYIYNNEQDIDIFCEKNHVSVQYRHTIRCTGQNMSGFVTQKKYRTSILDKDLIHKVKTIVILKTIQCKVHEYSFCITTVARKVRKHDRFFFLFPVFVRK